MNGQHKKWSLNLHHAVLIKILAGRHFENVPAPSPPGKRYIQIARNL